MPAGIVGPLNALVRSGYHVVAVNEAVELRLDKTFSLGAWLSRTGADLVLVELHWYVHADGARHAARVAKETLPGVPVVLGGLTATAFAGEILSAWPEVDMVLGGEVDEPLVRLAHALSSRQDPEPVPNLWRRVNGRVVPPLERWVASGLGGMDHVEVSWLVHADEWERSDFPYRNRWLLVGRGCTRSCYFCGGSAPALRVLLGRTRPVVRPPLQVAEDIVRLARTGVQAVHLTHDLFSLGKRYWQPLFEAVRRSGLTVGLGNESWGPLPDREILQAWAHTFDVSRSYVALSPTSAWSGFAALASRRIDAGALFRALEVMASLSFPLHVFFLDEIPGETASTLERTMDLAWQVVQRYPPTLLRMELQPAPIDPGSPAAMGLTPSFAFRRPALEDYLAISRDTRVDTLVVPTWIGQVDPGEPCEVPRARARDLVELAARCPAFAARYRHLLSQPCPASPITA